MSIQALPQSVLLQVDSTVSIPSSVALVKELLDNSIDSGASMVEVFISANTVDKIEVRDNGYGIQPLDFDSLGRRGHTSKLRNLDELVYLGGASLGFRGMALASINAVADITITTRTAGEPVAAMLKLAFAGGVAVNKPTSGPVGTTVTIANIFSRSPVRRQLAYKAAGKTLSDIKTLLQSYGLARLNLRLSFRAVGNAKLTWSYAPKPELGPVEAVHLVFGSISASQCMFKQSLGNKGAAGTTGAVTSDPTGSTEIADGFAFQACMPKLDADSSRVPRGGFISVDSRPLSSSRGIAKKLLSSFRKYFVRAKALDEATAIVRDPFIQLNIKCPPGSYDSNIEPAKDDVCFIDEATLLAQFESFLFEAYLPSQLYESDKTACRLAHPPESSRKDSHIEYSPADQDSEIEASREDNEFAGGLYTELRVVEDVDHTDSAHKQRQRDPKNIEIECNHSMQQNHRSRVVDMPNSDVTDGHSRPSFTLLSSSNGGLETVTVDGIKYRRASNPLTDLNPWSIANIKAQIRQPEAQIDTGSTHLPPSQPQMGGSSHTEERHGEATPPDLSPRTNRNIEKTGSDQVTGPTSKATRCNVHGGRFRQPRPLRALLAPGSHQPPSENGFGLLSPSLSSDPNDPNKWTLKSNPMRRPEAHHHRRLHMPVPFLAYEGRSCAQGTVMNTDRGLNNRAVEESTREKFDGFSEEIRSPGLRCRKARARSLEGDICRGQKRHCPFPTFNVLGHRQSRSFSRTLFEEDGRSAEIDEHVNRGLSQGDSRAYLMRRQVSAAHNGHKRLKRLKTNALPLETIPLAHETRNIRLTVNGRSDKLVACIDNAWRYDAFISRGELGAGLGLSIRSVDATAIERRVRCVLSMAGMGEAGNPIHLTLCSSVDTLRQTRLEQE